MNFLLKKLRAIKHHMSKVFHDFQAQGMHQLPITLETDNNVTLNSKSEKQPRPQRKDWKKAYPMTGLAVSLSVLGYSLPALAGGTTFCQSPYGEVYGTVTPNSLHVIKGSTGASALLTTSTIPGITAINGMATDHVNKLVYYQDGNAIYAWNALTNQHIVITNNFRSLLPISYTSTRTFTSLSSGGAAFYNGSLYVGVDGGPTNPDFEIFKVDFNTGGQTIQTVTPLDIVGNSGGGLVRTNEDWGDFTISDTGIILALTSRTRVPHLWNYNLNTNQYTNIGDPTGGNHQFGKSGDAKIWALFSSGNVQEIFPNGTYTGPTNSTIAVSDGGECVIGNSNVGDRVWADVNGNGLQDGGELGIAGVSVSIYRDINKDGILQGTEPLLATQATDANGNYNFTELLPHDRLTGAGHNDFIIQVAGGVPTNYTATTVVISAVDLSSATQTVSTVDFGYKPNSDLTITKTHTGNFTHGQTGATYTVTARNSGPGATSGLVTVVDTLPTGLTATGISGFGWTCTLATRTCTRSDVLAASTSYPAITLTVDVATNAAASVTNSATVSGGGELTTTNNTATDPTTVVTASPNLRLVKRITAINGTIINTVIDPNTTSDLNDNALNWPIGYLKGVVDGGLVKPNDEVEYTIYFLSDGDSPVRRVQVCDLVPTNNNFIATIFNGLTPTDGGLPGADSGIALSIGSTAPTVYLTNVAGDGKDRGEFLDPDTTTPASCGTSNTDGAVVVDVVTDTTTPSNLPNATTPGTPTGSYGFIRFRALVK